MGLLEGEWLLQDQAAIISVPRLQNGGKKMARSYYDDHFDPGADREELRERHQKKREISRPKVYVRYDEGAELYSMCKNTFIKFVYKINRLSLVNTKIFEEYLETFRI